jgi:hypothetical protein
MYLCFIWGILVKTVFHQHYIWRGLLEKWPDQALLRICEFSYGKSKHAKIGGSPVSDDGLVG